VDACMEPPLQKTNVNWSARSVTRAEWKHSDVRASQSSYNATCSFLHGSEWRTQRLPITQRWRGKVFINSGITRPSLRQRTSTSCDRKLEDLRPH
jgi:hypothetical protein